MKSDEARARIQKLLVTGDNRLKQGVDPQKARESWEQAPWSPFSRAAEADRRR